MDIHKPKPWHGVREFLKEYVIIVIGVLTALAAEQGVEWLHWRQQVRTTEERLLPEVQRNLLDLSERVVERPCLAERTANLRDALLQSDGHWEANPYYQFRRMKPLSAKPHPSLADVAATSNNLSGQAMPRVYGTPSRPWADTVFQSALVNGVFNHMPNDRSHAYAVIYRGMIAMRERQATEQAASARLSALAFDGVLSPGERAADLNALGELDYAAGSMAQSAAQVLISADKIGLRPRRSEFEKRFPASSPLRSCYATVTIPLAPN
jgi:hypothetical protein